jgi:hypothetical protein
MSFFITSGKGTQIFSENSFTVIFSSIVTSVFFTRFAEVVASLCTFGATGLFSGFFSTLFSGCEV